MELAAFHGNDELRRCAGMSGGCGPVSPGFNFAAFAIVIYVLLVIILKAGGLFY
jgi:hypothetical protein